MFMVTILLENVRPDSETIPDGEELQQRLSSIV
jgi:hypothetical protein